MKKLKTGKKKGTDDHCFDCHEMDFIATTLIFISWRFFVAME